MASAKVVIQNNNQGNWLLETVGLSELARMNKRQVLYQVLNFLMIVSSALMIWKGLMVLTKSERYLLYSFFCAYKIVNNFDLILFIFYFYFLIAQS